MLNIIAYMFQSKFPNKIFVFNKQFKKRVEQFSDFPYLTLKLKQNKKSLNYFIK